MNDSHDTRLRVYHPLYAPLPFRPLHYLREGGVARTATLVWLVLCFIAIPSGLITRYFELTGLDVVVAGETLHLTIYLPLLICFPLALWFGFWWAAIPAYCSTFLVAISGGMPLPWIFVFALSNPLGLGTLLLVYRVAPLRLDLRDVISTLGFIGLALVSAMAGSAGSFVWAHTNEVGLNEFYPVWQGWWLGGFLQALLLGAPTLALLSPYVLGALQPLRVDSWQQTFRRSWLLSAIFAVLLTLIAFVFIVRGFGLTRVGELLPLVDSTVRDDLRNAVDGLAYSHWIMIMGIGLAGYFAYQGVVHWTTALRAANRELEEKNRALVTLSVTDSLTGVFNRRQLFELAQGEFAKSKRDGSALAVLMVDVDHFKRINDRFGHQVGDQVLQLMVERLSNGLRPYDILGRYGGEEFMLLLPGADVERAQRVAKRLLLQVSDEPFDIGHRLLRLSVSVGVAAIDEKDQTIEPIVGRADDALLEVKRSGRNQFAVGQRRTAQSSETTE